MAEAATVENGEGFEGQEERLDDSQGYFDPNVRGKNGPKPGTQGKRAREESSAEERASFFELTSALTDTEWERHMLYVYQFAPILDLTRGGAEKKYRRMYTRHQTEEDIKRDLGSGTYQLRLNKTDGKTRRDRTIRTIVVSIMDFDFPPNIPPGAWLDDPRNAEWNWAKGPLEKKYNVNQSAHAGSNGAPTWPEMMTFMRDEIHRTRPELGGSAKEQLMSSVVGILPQLLQQQNAAQDPSKFLEAIATAVKMFIPAPAEHKADPMLTFVLEELREGRKQHAADMLQMRTQHAEEMKEMRTANAKLLESQTKPPDLMSQLDVISNVAAKFSGLAGEPKKFWETAIEEGVPKLIDLFGAFMTMPRVPVPRPLPPAAMQAPHAAPPAAPANTAQPAATQPTANQTSPVPEVQIPEIELTTLQRSMLVNIANLASAALNLGLLGDQFADQMVFKYGEANYQGFIASVKKEDMLNLFRQVPEAWQYLAPFEAMLPAFIEQFYAFNEAEEVEETATVPADEPPKKGKGKKK